MGKVGAASCIGDIELRAAFTGTASYSKIEEKTVAMISYNKVQDYLTSLLPEREPELRKMEKYAERNYFPIIGPVCGYYCYQLTRLIGARSVFELGSGYGYSTAWFAKAVKENGGGIIHHTVWDEQLSSM